MKTEGLALVFHSAFIAAMFSLAFHACHKRVFWGTKTARSLKTLLPAFD